MPLTSNTICSVVVVFVVSSLTHGSVVLIEKVALLSCVSKQVLLSNSTCIVILSLSGSKKAKNFVNNYLLIILTVPAHESISKSIPTTSQYTNKLLKKDMINEDN